VYLRPFSYASPGLLGCIPVGDLAAKYSPYKSSAYTETESIVGLPIITQARLLCTTHRNDILVQTCSNRRDAYLGFCKIKCSSRIRDEND
jgi:hypothetical protein